MKKYFAIFLLLVMIFTVLLTLDYYEIISLTRIGERVLINIPVISRYVKTGQQYDELDDEFEELEASYLQLQEENSELLEKLEEAETVIANQENIIAEQEEKIEVLQTERLVGEERVNKLVEIYGNMEPARVAEIIKSMDFDLALKLLTNLPEGQTAAILSILPPERAAEFSREM